MLLFFSQQLRKWFKSPSVENNADLRQCSHMFSLEIVFILIPVQMGAGCFITHLKYMAKVYLCIYLYKRDLWTDSDLLKPPCINEPRAVSTLTKCQSNWFSVISTAAMHAAELTLTSPSSSMSVNMVNFWGKYPDVLLLAGLWVCSMWSSRMAKTLIKSDNHAKQSQMLHSAKICSECCAFRDNIL